MKTKEETSFAFQLRQLLYQVASSWLGKRVVKLEEIELEHPPEPAHGDYATNLALKLHHRCLTSPPLTAFELAHRLVNRLRSLGLPDYLAKIEVAPPGFINFWLTKTALVKQLERVLKEKDQFGTSGWGKKEGVMFEFAHPNTHKQFHLGHLRTTALGESLARIYEALGFRVYRANYQGDVGLHIAKCLWGIKKLGLRKMKVLRTKVAFLARAYVEGNQAYEKDPEAREAIKKLNFLVYAAGQRFQKRKLKGISLTDYQKLAGTSVFSFKEIYRLWQETRRWSLSYFEAVYRRLGTRFDRYYFESEVADPGKALVLKYLKKGVFRKSQGAVIFPGKRYGLHNRVFINQAGLPTYEAKDLALAQLQFFEFKIQRCIHVVGSEQKDYFAVIFKALAQIAPTLAQKEEHLSYGWVSLKKGKMSSRAGTLVEINWLLDEVKKEIFKLLAENKELTKKEKEVVAEKVAVGAVKYWVLKINPATEIQFDIKESVSLEGNSGSYLQYTYARCRSVLRKSKQNPLLERFEATILEKRGEELALLRLLYRFPEVVRRAGEQLAPNLVANFLFELAQRYNLFYQNQPILQAETEALRCLRLALTAGVAQVIKNGLWLLGIEVVERM